MSNSERDILTSIENYLRITHAKIWHDLEPFSDTEFFDYRRMEMIEEIQTFITQEKEKHGIERT